MKRALRFVPSPAMVVSCLALSVALGGVGYAATALPRNSVGTPQLKKNAVTSIKVKDRSLLARDFKAGQLPRGARGPTGAQGAQGAKGDKGDTGTVDTSNFFTKGDSDARFQPRTCCAVSGQVLSGQFSEHRAANESFFLVSGTYQNPLPPGTPVPTLEFLPGGTPSATCPGIGNATAGRLCVYGYNTSNLRTVNPVTYGGNNEGESHRFGFGFDVFAQTAASESYIIANWAYKVP